MERVTGCEERTFCSRRGRPQAEEDGFFFCVLLSLGYGDELRGRVTGGKKRKGAEGGGN